MVSKPVLVSVIVPAYNVADYLEKCVNSILDQTYRSIEVILVDDGSTDGETAIICNRFAKIDSRVKVIHKANGGLSDARNVGIAASRGKYLSFIDGDDYVDHSFVEKLLKNAWKEGADIAVCSYSKVYDGKKISPNKTIDHKVFSNRSALLDLFTYPSLNEVMTWNKIYKRKLFTDNDILFPVGRLHEDNFTTYKTLFYAKKIVFFNEPLYFYLQRHNSIMGGQFRDDSKDILRAGDEIIDFVNKNIPNLTNQAVAYRLSLYIYYLNLHIDSGSTKKYLWSSAVKSLGSTKGNAAISNTHRLLVGVARRGYVPYKLLRKLYNLKAKI